MFRSYDHLQVEIYTWKLTRLLFDVGVFLENGQVVTVGESPLCCCCCCCCCCVFNVCGWGLWLVFFNMLFVVVYYDVEDRVVNVCVYVIKL
jgi:hypothetical protein